MPQVICIQNLTDCLGKRSSTCIISKEMPIIEMPMAVRQGVEEAHVPRQAENIMTYPILTMTMLLSSLHSLNLPYWCVKQK